MRPLLVACLVLLVASVAWAQPAGTQRKQAADEKRLAELEKEVDGLKGEIAALRMAPLPSHVVLCGRAIPLSDVDVRECFEREFYQFLERKGLLTILIRRYGKFLTVVSTEIERAGMPPDLIYLAIAESYLDPRAFSKASAGGLWQFIRDTGKREGLVINDCIDERYSVTRSTKSALAYLTSLHDEFGDWLVAMAAYNAGEVRLREVMENQKTRDFFEMFLPEETERYVYRIAALKEILGNPKKYGLPIGKKDYYRPYSVAEVTVRVDKEAETSFLAAAMDLPYRMFRQYNLQIRKYKLPKGVYHVYVPVDRKETFLKRLRAASSVTLTKDRP